jgi:hypothetical protein
MSDEVHVNDIGTEFRITLTEEGTAVDISAATSLQILIRKPSDTLLELEADLYTDGTDGVITYTSVDGDLDEVGTHKIQGKIEIDGGVFYSSIGSFKVHHNV